MNIDNPKPPTYLHTYLFPYPSTHLLIYLFTYPQTHLPTTITYLPTQPLIYLLPTS
jgi:hypothetical protein